MAIDAVRIFLKRGAGLKPKQAPSRLGVPNPNEEWPVARFFVLTELENYPAPIYEPTFLAHSSNGNFLWLNFLENLSPGKPETFEPTPLNNHSIIAVQPLLNRQIEESCVAGVENQATKISLRNKEISTC